MTVAPGVEWLRLPLPMTLGHVNVYLLADEDGLTLVDTGIDTETCRAALERGLAGRRVRRVIATHYHPDHIGLAGWLQARGAELWTTQVSWLFTRMLVLDEQPLPLPETVAFWRAAGMEPGLLARRAQERPFNFADSVHPLPLGYRRIREGDTLTAGGRRWTVRIGEGHAPDHATLWSLDDDLVLGGDQLLPSISANLGVHATQPLADPVRDWLESCRRFQPLAEERHLVLPGHKLPFTGLPLRLRQMIDNHESALNRLRALLAEGPRSAAACFPALFKRPIGEAVYGLALVEAVAHLNHLLLRGEARREMVDGIWIWTLDSRARPR
ncbi:MBL fold metallo-hydrolase [Paenirhodobacter sp.]|uniref:MBL fold metallo-hydrolase n=1 Tax=Paenirhodobacter sp. TaxID=1965326 RepID=UPI003B3F378D